MSGKKPAVFFDRDGVINRDLGYVGDASRFELIEGAARAIKLCRDAGYWIFVITNQAGVAHGHYGEDAVKTLHVHMKNLLATQGAAIDDIRYCPHHPDAKLGAYRKVCSWRKPGAGMILDLAKHWPVELGRSFLIGDKQSDMAAAREAGIRGFLYESGPLDRFAADSLSRMGSPA